MNTFVEHVYDNGTLKITFNLQNEDEEKNTIVLPLNDGITCDSDCDEITPTSENDENDEIKYYLNIEFRDLSSFNTFNKKYTLSDITKHNPLFEHNCELLFDLFEKKPHYFNITKNILTISYILNIGKRKYNINLEIYEKIEEGENQEINKLRLQNEFLSKKIFKLEQEHKKIIIVNILTSPIATYEKHFELFKSLVSTNFDINCDLSLYSYGNVTKVCNVFHHIYTHQIATIINDDEKHDYMRNYLKLVISLGADVNWKAHDNSNTVIDTLFKSCYSTPFNQYLQIFELLLDNGADVNIVDNQNKTLLETIDDFLGNVNYKKHHDKINETKRLIMKKLGKW
jgi:hypothetical protein